VNLNGSSDSPISDGDLSLEVRWIIPGVLAPDMVEWFGPPSGGIETRRDYYLVSATGPDVGIKIRGGCQLDIKLYGGSPNPLTVLGQSQGRLGWWRKWSFPHLRADAEIEPAGWTSVKKVRRVRYFSLDGRPVLGKADATVRGGCAVELTDVIVERRSWWTLGFEATGPAEALTDELNAAVAVMFDHPLPRGVRLDAPLSRSYSEWLVSNSESHLAHH